jgi:hypothetical protein
LRTIAGGLRDGRRQTADSRRQWKVTGGITDDKQ